MSAAALAVTLFGAGAALASALIAIARRLAIAWDFVARPNPIVRSHRVPVPYLGGMALILAVAAMLAGAAAFVSLAPDALTRAGLAVALAVFGTIDDRRPFGPAAKLAVQAAVAVVYLAARGPTSAAAFVIELFVLLTLINAYNVIDVMDGLLCLIAAAAIVGLLGIAPDALRVELWVTLGAIAAMFLFNRPPARIYNGDAGSLALGFLIGAWCLEVASAAPARAPALAGVVAVPLLELALIVPARLLQGRNPMRGSPDHFALRLQDRLGWSQWRVLAVTLVVATIFALAPFIAASLARPAVLAYVVMVSAIAFSSWYALWRIPPPARA